MKDDAPRWRDSLTDVPGLRVGHATRAGRGWLTGTTVVLAPETGMVAAVDVRGGGPGTRETDALDPRNLVDRVDAVLLTGGSAYGLDAASGVMAWLEERGRGFRAGPKPEQVVPVVPAACLFDLGRGGDWRARPDAALGREAVERASVEVGQGNVGAGTGAVAGSMKGGVGTAAVRLPGGATVGALAVVNAVGSVRDPETGVLYGRYFMDGGERPDRAVHLAARESLERAEAETARRTGAAGARAPFNTTLAVVATDAGLDSWQAKKLAGSSHDGLARAVRPVHLLHDGDMVFALSTGARPLAQAGENTALAMDELLAAGADVVMRAIVKAAEAARGVDGPGGLFPAYRELYGERRDTESGPF
ncbi:P1 family peptidase [Streptomyces tsukubensis]|uniref:Hydrolase n=1 Tax=Streptomyces tsukubensis TaxID=83656 RepID=A0A1V4A601_9ACTN|nr:P1 family peptidase [Streptomyces tsukubensis]OON76002.1 hypothetical protein B1H18_22015 [Streptomyces tsukubensis]QFR94094.1 hypothetical protein GBW32_14810 [Streptomyces tsukubensis]